MILVNKDKKNVATVILRRAKGNPTFDELKEANENLSHAGNPSDFTSAKEAAMDQIMNAVSTKNRNALMSGLSSFLEMKKGESGSETP